MKLPLVIFLINNNLILVPIEQILLSQSSMTWFLPFVQIHRKTLSTYNMYSNFFVLMDILISTNLYMRINAFSLSIYQVMNIIPCILVSVFGLHSLHNYVLTPVAWTNACMRTRNMLHACVRLPSFELKSFHWSCGMVIQCNGYGPPIFFRWMRRNSTLPAWGDD